MDTSALTLTPTVGTGRRYKGRLRNAKGKAVANSASFGFWTLSPRARLRQRLRNAKGKAVANSASFGFWIKTPLHPW